VRRANLENSLRTSRIPSSVVNDQQNATRSDFAQRLQEIIDTYNSGSSSADNDFEAQQQTGI